jgi:hypothetical protein
VVPARAAVRTAEVVRVFRARVLAFIEVSCGCSPDPLPGF